MKNKKKHLLRISSISIFATVLTLAILFITSCTKEAPLQEEQLVEFNNPFKEYGILHNEVLGEILEKTSKTGLTKENIISAAKEVAYSRGLMNSKNDSEFPEKKIMEIYECIDETFEDMTTALVDKGYVSEKMN